VPGLRICVVFTMEGVKLDGQDVAQQPVAPAGGVADPNHQAYMNNMAQWQAVMQEYYKSAQNVHNNSFPNAYNMWAQQVMVAGLTHS
jgi:hypothetical protein